MKLTGTPVAGVISEDSRGLGCHLTQSTGQSVVDTSSPEILLFDTETYDDLGFHSTSTDTDKSRIVIPADVSRILICCITSTVDKSTHVGTDYVQLLKNGAVVTGGENGEDWLIDDDAMTPAPNFASPVSCVAGDYFEIQFGHDDTTARLMDTNKTWFACVVLRC